MKKRHLRRKAGSKKGIAFMDRFVMADNCAGGDDWGDQELGGG